MIDNAVTGWVIEAYYEDAETLAWEVPLLVARKEDLERDLRMSLQTPDVYPITPRQVIAAVRVFASDVSPDQLDLDPRRLSFFLAAVARG
ncbi:hypothetical protein [Actinophytocola sp. NPDC049390]|uniref:hypothetical protein n=1 Tax=Actinophytocola sp. NPDC049390 TaxID=3363894 RepID=UPI0037B33878